GRLDQPDHGTADGRLAAPGLTNEPQGLAFANAEAHVFDGTHVADRAPQETPAHRKMHGEAVDLEHRVGRGLTVRHDHLDTLDRYASTPTGGPSALPCMGGTRPDRRRLRAHNAARRRTLEEACSTAARCRGSRRGAPPQPRPGAGWPSAGSNA